MTLVHRLAMKHRLTCAAAAVLTSTLLAPTAARAALIVDTGAPTSGIAGSDAVNAGEWLAQSFTVAASTTIDAVSVAVLDASPASDAGQTFQLALYADGSDHLPGLDFNADNQGRLQSVDVTYTADGWVGASGLTWALAAGTYWLAVEAGSDAGAVTALQLPVGGITPSGAVAYYSGGRGYAATGPGDTFGLRVDASAAVAAVPEPSGWALMLLGLVTCMAMTVLRRRRG